MAGRPKGLPKTGGRKPGSPNKATVEFRQTVQALLDDNRENVAKWLALVAEGDKDKELKPEPAKALDLLAKLAEYAAPKLSRSEVNATVATRSLDQELAELNEADAHATGHS